MKKIILALLVIFSLFIFTVPTYAETCDDCKKTFCETCGQELPENETCETCEQEIKEENIETNPIIIRTCNECGMALLDTEMGTCENCQKEEFTSDFLFCFLLFFMLGSPSLLFACRS